MCFGVKWLQSYEKSREEQNFFLLFRDAVTSATANEIKLKCVFSLKNAKSLVLSTAMCREITIFA